jgi:D-glycero-alpha-D-manno-heptose-7-phosphate kinase
MIISRTPVRLSFAGGGTDFDKYYRLSKRQGAVISTTINRYIYIFVNKRFDDLIQVSYSKTEIVESVDDVEHNIVREALKLLGIEKAIEIVYVADLPLTTAGSGLGSSSALAVGVLNALYAYKGVHASSEQLASEAYLIEQNILGHPVGKQDQYIAAYGGLNFIQFNNDGSVFVDPVICRPDTKRNLERCLMLFYTGLDRASCSILSEQQDQIEEKVALHDKLVEIAVDLRAKLHNNELEEFGDILHSGWMAKRQLASGISNSKIDNWYERARSAGARGGKIAGAGGGGFLLLFCDEDRQQAVRDSLPMLSHDPVKLEPQGSEIIYVSD